MLPTLKQMFWSSAVYSQDKKLELWLDPMPPFFICTRNDVMCVDWLDKPSIDSILLNTAWSVEQFFWHCKPMKH